MSWHFSNLSETLGYGDGRKTSVGVTHTVDCEPVLGKKGLHASPSVLDALQYAPGPILWRVTLGGTIVHGEDKSCATERTYLARLDATEVLREFARKCALQVVHLWDAPQVVVDYLTTGNEMLRDKAADAARAASTAAFEANVVSDVIAYSADSAIYAADYATFTANAAAYATAASAAHAAASTAYSAYTAYDAYLSTKAEIREVQKAMLQKMIDELMA